MNTLVTIGAIWIEGVLFLDSPLWVKIFLTFLLFLAYVRYDLKKEYNLKENNEKITENSVKIENVTDSVVITTARKSNIHIKNCESSKIKIR